MFSIHLAYYVSFHRITVPFRDCILDGPINHGIASLHPNAVITTNSQDDYNTGFNNMRSILVKGIVRHKLRSTISSKILPEQLRRHQVVIFDWTRS